jgi:large subunit ribosomal protein L17
VRHNYYGRKLNRNKNERTSLFRNLVRSLILSESIQTTNAKAKAIQPTVDKLINQAKSPSTRTLANQFVVDKTAFEKLVKELTPKMKSRNSGYTSIIKVGRRAGDDARMVTMRLILDVDGKSENQKIGKSEKVEKAEIASQGARNDEKAVADAKPAKAAKKTEKTEKKGEKKG